MYAEERQSAIATEVRSRGRVSVADLAARFAVTGETVRRDLLILQRSGHLVRVHGGAVRPDVAAVVDEPDLSVREETHRPEKVEIGTAALAYLPATGGSVLIDAGTTTLQTALAIHPDTRLTYITNSVQIGGVLAELPGSAVLLTGGRLRPKTGAAVGADAVDMLGRVRASVGFIGTNVTIPHKFSALQAVDVVDAQARRLGAVNTVVFRDGRAFGSNSDGPGFVRSVREAFCAAVGDLRVLILGAGGGAGRAVAVQCALENCRHLTLVNRTPEKSAALAGEIAGFFPKNRLSVADWSGEALRRALPQVDLIINGTNLGMKPEDPPVLPQGCLEARHLVHDMVYRPAVTPLVAMARDAGASAVNGLPMLLHQGAVSFESWFSQPAPLEIMRQSLWAAAGVPP